MPEKFELQSLAAKVVGKFEEYELNLLFGLLATGQLPKNYPRLQELRLHCFHSIKGEVDLYRCAFWTLSYLRLLAIVGHDLYECLPQAIKNLKAFDARQTI